MATTVTAKRKAKKKSVMKRIRLTERRTAINRKRKGNLRAQVKKLRRALDSGDAAQAQELLKPTLSVLDRAARKGILHRNTAARTKSRLLQRYNSLQQKAQTAA
jgi:small subunit ribosomal protein S20